MIVSKVRPHGPGIPAAGQPADLQADQGSVDHGQPAGVIQPGRTVSQPRGCSRSQAFATAAP